MQEKALLKSCQKAVQIPGESGQEKEVAHFVKKLMLDLNYDRVWIDDWGNVIGVIGNNPSPTILLEGHLDTVGVENPDDWQYDPYGGVIENGRLYGRGSSDMRSALIAMIYAGAEFAAKKEKLQGQIVVSGIVQEELFEGVAQETVLKAVDPDLVVIGEASNLNLCIGQRGRAEIKVTTFGKNAHSSNPEKGINAIRLMNQLLKSIDNLRPPQNRYLGRGILEMVDILSIPYPGRSVIPHKCLVTFDRRLLPDESEVDVLQPVRDIINDLKKKIKDFSAEVKIAEAEAKTYNGHEFKARRFFPGWIFPADSTFVSKALSGLKNAGINSKIDYYSFCTDGSQSAGRYNIPTVGFGPSREELAHVVDEYIELEEIKKAYHGYVGILRSFMF
ncbi:MAG: YgeY family selenium metabolism-linked hydrolase [Halanaerobiales bacterium]